MSKNKRMEEDKHPSQRSFDPLDMRQCKKEHVQYSGFLSNAPVFYS